jgi:serine/threonine protein kinase
MTCSTCNLTSSETARFCSNCGAELCNPIAFGSTTTELERDPLFGSAIAGKYRVDAKLGAGGMGVVYRATRLLIGDEVAIKILHSEQTDPKAAERFRREARAAARLKHPNAVTIHDFGVTDDGLQYLVMELVEGESLRQIIKQQGPLTPSASAEIVSQVCAALEEAHRHHIIHRDIKPDNIIVNVSATGLRVKVLDFNKLNLGAGGTTLGGVTWNQGKWTGRLSLTR